MIEYKVRIADAGRHLFEVDCRVNGATDDAVFEFPSWIPGSYLLREYVRHVVAAEAFDDRGRSMPLEKIAHNVWRCRNGGDAVTLRLLVYALDASVRGAWLDGRRAYFNGPCLFARPRSGQDSPVRLTLVAPVETAFERWRVATSMPQVDTDERGFGVYGARDYDDLLDHPFEIGTFDRIDFDVQGTAHSLVVAGTHDGDLDRVAADLKKLCRSQIHFFGDPPPFDLYVFLCAVLPSGYGGLEHRSSSSLMFHRDDLPQAGNEAASPRYRKMLSLASHEYFHAWHVKRTRPAAFIPYDLGERNHTRLLWVFEGITSYYQDRFLLRSGLIDEHEYLRRLGEIVSSVWRVPGRYRQSLAESSFDAWDKLYKPDANSPNAGVSYYSKGAVIALALDLEIRLRRDSRTTLDTVVRELWREFGSRDIGVPEDGFERLARKLGGEELADFFEYAVRGTEDPPLRELFAQFAIEMNLANEPPRPDTDSQDAAFDSRSWLGVIPKNAAGCVECVTVLDGGPAQRAGLNPGDVVVALQRRKVSFENLDAVLSRHRAGDRITITAFRGDDLLDFDVALEAAPANTCSLKFAPNATAARVARRSAWLEG